MIHQTSRADKPGLTGRIRNRRLIQAVVLVSLCGAMTSAVAAQVQGEQASGTPDPVGGSKEDLSPTVATVDVTPVAHDEQILARLQSVLEATGWFVNPRVEVQEGVVFLSGPAQTDELKKWAGDLARNTQDVVAVANRMEVIEPSVWDFSPAWNGLRALWRDFVRSLPALLFGFVILALSAAAGVLVAKGSRAFLRRRVRANLLRIVMARGQSPTWPAVWRLGGRTSKRAQGRFCRETPRMCEKEQGLAL